MNDTLKYFWVKCYNSISVRLQIYSVNAIEYQLAFLVPLPWTNNSGMTLRNANKLVIPHVQVQRTATGRYRLVDQVYAGAQSEQVEVEFIYP
jgi:hypothetical protein